MDKTATSTDYVNTERGSRKPNVSYKAAKEDSIMEAIRELRLEMKVLMDNQIKEYEILRYRFINTETELKELRKEMKVLQEKVDKVQILEAKVDNIVRKDGKLESNTVGVSPKIDKNEKAYLQKETIQSFAAVANQNQNRVVINKFPTKQVSVASKPSNKPTTEKSTTVKEIPEPKQGRNNSEQIIENEDIEPQKEGNWTTVNRKKKSRYPNTEVKKGGSTSAVEIKGTERKKFLHVWRLHKETTIENLEKYVKNICGQEVPVTVERIRHKTERDYSSFIIGVPESSYDTLYQSDNWAINIEFSEWVWFRRTTK